MHLLANRALVLAARQVAGGIGPDQLLYGVLQDARAPLGTGLGRRAARKLALFGFRAGRPNPGAVAAGGRAGGGSAALIGVLDGFRGAVA